MDDFTTSLVTQHPVRSTSTTALYANGSVSAQPLREAAHVTICVVAGVRYGKSCDDECLLRLHAGIYFPVPLLLDTLDETAYSIYEYMFED